MVADALSRKSSVTLAHIRTAYVLLLLDMKTFGISLVMMVMELCWTILW